MNKKYNADQYEQMTNGIWIVVNKYNIQSGSTKQQQCMTKLSNNINRTIISKGRVLYNENNIVFTILSCLLWMQLFNKMFKTACKT